ncbi:alpha/beta hydrolase [Streptomyces sp. NPDC058683]|uniref:alpha/beta hydrolase n=1 Tax=Streptomyces sp. NPDC058683 TaxID=3346597 RepID=UPI0036510701
MVVDEQSAPPRAAVVAPGGMYGPHVPLLMYAADAAEARGARIERITWDPPSQADRGSGHWVLDQVAPVLDHVSASSPGAVPVLIGKSLGTNAAVLAAERGLPAIWLTPLLTTTEVIKALRAATAPFLLVGGTEDRHWDGALAVGLSPHVLEVRGADHGMHVPGPLAGSADVLGRVATAVEDFLDRIVWPAAA